MLRPCPSCASVVPPEARFCPHCGAHADDDLALEPRPGTLVDDRYRVTARLGEGAASTVFLARHERLERDVALKVLKPEHLARPTALERFAREAWAAARVAHDNVIQVFDFGAAPQGFHYLVMEYVSGVALDVEIAQRGALGVTRAVHIVSQIASGLHAAHALGVVHRDLKPSNVMLTQRGADPDFVKVVDFGLAREVATQEPVRASLKLSTGRELLGSPAYMAPECWNGSVADVRADVYALGIVAFELLTGRLPFEADSLIGLMLQHCSDTPPAPSDALDLGPAAPALDALVASCLRKEPELRPASMRDVLAALREVPLAKPAIRRTTYARVVSAPFRVPDPTMFDPGSVDVVWDGPGLCVEINRLRELRRQRIGELVQALSPTGAPAPLAALLGEGERADAEAAAATAPVIELEAALVEVEQSLAMREAEVRGSLVEASLTLAVARQRMPEASMAWSSTLQSAEAAETTDRHGPLAPPAASAEVEGSARIRRLEKKLSSLGREWRAREHHARLALETAVHNAARVLLAASGPWSAIWAEMTSATRGRRELRPLLQEVAKVDGAIGSYGALLAALSEDVE